jgi:hypothetical protein
MNRNRFWSTFWLGTLCALSPAQLTLKAVEPVDFNRDIRPILSDRCFLCHGPDQAARQADLRLDSFSEATVSAIKPGDAQASELMARITATDADLVMPPPDSHKTKLTAEQIELFRQWIDQGAVYAQHWAYVAPRKTTLPAAVMNQLDSDSQRGSPVGQGAVQNPIDAFVRAKLEQLGMAPAEPADRAALLRRITLDLTGLPPTPEELQAFLNDSSAQATEQVVTRLFKSPAYGEHMARYWLDAARYADSNGYQYDFARQQWAWRDWVIDAFNRNLRFDQFTIEQLAGDLLPEASDQQRLATGFNRNHPITVEGGIIDEEYRTEYVIDRVVTTGTVWMGATLLCARCHDHKFDPTTQREFYQLVDFFNQVPEKGMQGFAPQATIASPLQMASLQQAEQVAERAQREFQADFEAWRSAHPELAEVDSGTSIEAQWWTPAPLSQRSEGGAQLIAEEEGAVFVKANPDANQAPPQDIYELIYDLPAEQTVAVIRLEALSDKRLPGRGTSLSDNSNFVLTEITAELAPIPSTSDNSSPASIAYQPLTFKLASADYSQRNYPVTAAIDGKFDKTGWAVDGNEHTLRVNRTALFALGTPLQSSQPHSLRLRLYFKSPFDRHALGKFRISMTSDSHVLVSDDISSALALSREQRTAEQQLAVERHIASTRGSPELQSGVQALAAAQSQLDEVRKAIPATMIMQDQATKRESFILVRGEYDKPSDQVTANTPAYLPPLHADYPRNRLGFAKWLVAAENPLTARVTVNRLWQQFFGVGFVDTPEDFGLQGNSPSHPELLDWLAVDFVESGWDVQHLIRTIVLSATYQQSSVVTTESVARDPENRWLSRGPRVRLDAEMIRDGALMASGLLDRTLGGPSVFPYHPPGLWLEVNNRPGFSSPYEQDHGGNLYRRSMYTFGKRTVPAPAMSVFDAPDREVCQVRRSRTNTPLQAFVLLHDPQFVEAGRKLAERMLQHAPGLLTEQVEYGYELTVGRKPTAAELQVMTEAYTAEESYFREHPELAKTMLAVGESSVDQSWPISQLAAMTNIARLLMNLSEFVTKG